MYGALRTAPNFKLLAAHGRSHLPLALPSAIVCHGQGYASGFSPSYPRPLCWIHCSLFRTTGLGKSGEYALPRTNKFSEGNHERDFVSVLVQAGGRYAVPRDVSLTSCYIPCEHMLMNVPQVFRHHHRQLPTNQLLCLVAKRPSQQPD